uniref:PDZ domain-containing protein n=1 Tax=Chrysotila carterae TaxID=13221 RepID=A0A7S4B401_CHRCT|mmetsp:Transcript_15112/g.32286  ORF Transcript_15112/g.32286 Transcript_15112/m.32286 type:complete len:440 (-) Transcript_15112:235-1554(-)
MTARDIPGWENEEDAEPSRKPYRETIEVFKANAQARLGLVLASRLDPSAPHGGVVIDSLVEGCLFAMHPSPPQKGDALLEVNGQQTSGHVHASQLLREAVGRVTLTLLRGASTDRVAKPHQKQRHAFEVVEFNKSKQHHRLGLLLSESKQAVAAGKRDIVISELLFTGVLARKKIALRPGDEILEINGKSFSHHEAASAYLREVAGTIRILVKRCEGLPAGWVELMPGDDGQPVFLHENSGKRYYSHPASAARRAVDDLQLPELNLAAQVVSGRVRPGAEMASSRGVGTQELSGTPRPSGTQGGPGTQGASGTQGPSGNPKAGRIRVAMQSLDEIEQSIAFGPSKRESESSITSSRPSFRKHLGNAFSKRSVRESQARDASSHARPSSKVYARTPFEKTGSDTSSALSSPEGSRASKQSKSRFPPLSQNHLHGTNLSAL